VGVDVVMVVEDVEACIDKIFDAIEVCCITVRIEGENPPEKSVPRPTYSRVRGMLSDVQSRHKIKSQP
jgi:hypothetical protein